MCDRKRVFTYPNHSCFHSFKVVGRSWGIDSNKLKQKVGSIRFAGEATAGMWSDTTLGAWQTGQIAAEDIVQALASAE